MASYSTDERAPPTPDGCTLGRGDHRTIRLLAPHWNERSDME
jgi:hypothetical protein